MNRIEAITLAMSTAAAAQFRPNGFAQKRPEVQTYLALKQLLANKYKYPVVSNDILIDLQNAITILTKHLEAFAHEQRNRFRHPHHSTSTATPAYL